MNGTQDATPPPIRQRSIRAVRLATLVVVGVFLCWLTFQVEQRLSSPTTTPVTRDVTFDVVVSDADTDIAISNAEVGIDVETGEYDPPGPTWKGTTDASGRLRLVHPFDANTVLGKDGKVRGRVIFTLGTSIHSFSYLLAVKAPGYREESIDLGAKFSRGIDYEDLSPQTIQVLLSPSPPTRRTRHIARSNRLPVFSRGEGA